MPENEAILGEYNRLTSSGIPFDEFVRWVQASPAGPAWHAILETDEKRIVGHTSVFPLRTSYGGPERVPAKSEYSFLHEDFRSQKIRGFETVARPAFIVILDQLFLHCIQLGWGPIFASTPEQNQAFTRRVGLRAMEFSLRECFWILMPWNVARHTANLTSRQRAGLFSAGVAHRFLGPIASAFSPHRNGIRPTSIGADIAEPERERLSFFEDAASLRWRYLDGQYIRYEFDSSPGDYAIVKRGSVTNYLRVCQWRLRSEDSLRSLIAALIRAAHTDKAMGVRWAVYDDDVGSSKIVGRLQRLGFLCAPRVRTMMVHKKEEPFLAREMWKMNDSLFTFHP
jgi:hypothetical protein